MKSQIDILCYNRVNSRLAATILLIISTLFIKNNKFYILKTHNNDSRRQFPLMASP